MPPRGNRRRAPSGSGSVYQETTRRKRVDGTELVATRWVAAITLPNGQRKRFRAATEREALAKLKTMFSEQAQGAVLTTARQTVGEYLEWWLENSLRGKPTSLMTYTTIVRSHLVPTVGKHQLTQLQPEHVERMMADLKRRGLSAARINSVRATLQQALNVALRRRRVPLNAAALVDPYRVEHEEIEPLEPAECQRWFAVLRGERLGALYVLAMATGLRQGELLGLRWEDVDLDHARITVRQQMAIFADTDGKLRPQPQSPKTKRSRRSAPLPSFVIEALETHREQQALIRKVVGPNRNSRSQRDTNHNQKRDQWHHEKDRYTYFIHRVTHASSRSASVSKSGDFISGRLAAKTAAAFTHVNRVMVVSRFSAAIETGAGTWSGAAPGPTAAMVRTNPDGSRPTVTR